MMIARLFLLPALLLAAPAGAQAQTADDPLAVMSSWGDKFVTISAEPAAAAAACAPQFNNAVGGMRDSAGARTALIQIRPCLDRVRAAYSRSAQALAGLEPMPAALEARTSFDSRALIDEQRKQFAAALSYFDHIDALLTKVAADDRAGAAQLFPKVRAGGASLVDGTILMLRVRQGSARLAFARQALELRILTAMAGKVPMTAPIGSAGFTAGNAFRALAPQARTSAAAISADWEQDREKLRALLPGDPRMEQLIQNATKLVEDISASGERMAVALEQAGRQPVVPPAGMIALLSTLNEHDLTIAKSLQDFLQTLKAIGK